MKHYIQHYKYKRSDLLVASENLVLVEKFVAYVTAVYPLRGGRGIPNIPLRQPLFTIKVKLQ
jgi:hypothetical protein